MKTKKTKFEIIDALVIIGILILTWTPVFFDLYPAITAWVIMISIVITDIIKEKYFKKKNHNI